MAERLEVYRGDELVAAVPLEGRRLTIGRRASNDVVLEDLSVSKVHAAVEPRGAGWVIEDQGSTNGVLLGGARIQAAPFVAGKDFKVGKFVLRLAAHAEAAPADAGSAERRAAAAGDLERLFDLVGRCAAVFDMDELLNTVLDKVMEVFDSDRGFLLLGTDPDAGLETAVRRGIDAEGPHAELSRTLLREAFARGEPVLAGDADVLPASVEVTVASVLCAPLLDQGVPYGALYLDSRVETRVFGEDERRLLQGFCTGIAGVRRAAAARESMARDLRRRRLLARQDALREHDFREIVGTSAAIRRSLEQVAAVAPQDVTVLLQGESGTGKELFARAIHEGSERRDGPFVAINCMALSPEIIESELFGHEKGAFSGAVQRRVGKLELGEGGTVFLDEVGELSHEVQVKLLRVLEQREIQRVGGDEVIPLDVRLVTATNVDLKEASADGRFREDLYYRLNVFSLHLPPLRDRREDIPELVEFFVDHFNEKLGRAVKGAAPDVLRRLEAYDWPGNIRELRNVLERAMVLTRGATIRRDALPFDLDDGRQGARGLAAVPGDTIEQTMTVSTELDMTEARESLERKMIEDALAGSSGNIAAAARELGIPRKTLHNKIEALEIDMTAYGKRREALTREQIVAALEASKGAVSRAAQHLGVPRPTLYRNMEMFGVDPADYR